MGITNLDALTLEGELVAGGEITPAASQAVIQKIVETVALVLLQMGLAHLVLTIFLVFPLARLCCGVF